jgi:hypothetical protein
MYQRQGVPPVRLPVKTIAEWEFRDAEDHAGRHTGVGLSSTSIFLRRYDLVRDMPKTVCKDIRTRFGGFRLALLWLHSFEEPFLNAEEMEALGQRTDFVVEGTRFIGALGCLVLKKRLIQQRIVGRRSTLSFGETLGNQYPITHKYGEKSHASASRVLTGMERASTSLRDISRDRARLSLK